MHGSDGFPDGWWTVERIVAAIQNYAAKYGEVPGADWFNRAELRAKGRLDLLERLDEDRCYPNHNTVMRNVGSWSKAIELAGFEPRPIGRPPVETFGELPERCVNGHLWADNTFYKPGRSARYCRQCRLESGRRAEARKRGVVTEETAVRPPGARKRLRFPEPTGEQNRGDRADRGAEH